MSFFQKPIFTSISPTAQGDDIFLSLKFLIQPWKWKRGEGVKMFKKRLQSYLGVIDVFLFDSGRNALYAILLALNLKEGDEVLIQAFTCTAAVNPILWVKARPVYVDVSVLDYNMRPDDLDKKITSRSRAIIVQHTFGLPADMGKILSIAKKHRLIVIEDSAHALGGEYKRKKLGTIGDAAIFSFGRSKIISSISGGAAVVNNKTIAHNLEVFYKSCRLPKSSWILRQLLHPIIFSLVKSLYNFLYLGRIIALAAKILQLYTPSVSRVEKRGGHPALNPSLMPNVLAVLGLNQFGKLDVFNEHRVKLTKAYENALHKNKDVMLSKSIPGNKPILLYFPLILENFSIAERVLKKAKDKGIYLDVWPGKVVIGPPGTNLNKLFYVSGTCPTAEDMALRSIVLPTHPTVTIKDIMKIINLIDSNV